MTPRQRQILTYIGEFRNQYGVSPTVREIGRHIGLSSTSTTHSHIESLIRDGHLTRPTIPGAPSSTMSRGLLPTESGRAAMKARTHDV